MAWSIYFYCSWEYFSDKNDTYLTTHCTVAFIWETTQMIGCLFQRLTENMIRVVFTAVLVKTLKFCACLCLTQIQCMAKLFIPLKPF